MHNHKTICKMLRFLPITAAAVLLFMTAAFASDGGLGSSTVVTGTRNLIGDITKVLTGLSLSIGGGLMAYCLIRKGMADETDGKMWQKRAITAAICGILGALATSIIAVFAGYYGL